MNKESKVLALTPTFNDKQLIIVRGGVKVSDIFANSNHQATIISGHHTIPELIINHHEQYLHVGREQTLSSTCSCFWNPASRRLIYCIIKHCLYCKREKATSGTPFMANVATDRLCFNEKSFTKIDADYLGPYEIKLSKGSRSNQANFSIVSVLT